MRFDQVQHQWVAVGQRCRVGAVGVERVEDRKGTAVGMQFAGRLEQVVAVGVSDRRPPRFGDPFRRDALSKPVRFLDKYRDYV